MNLLCNVFKACEDDVIYVYEAVQWGCIVVIECFFVYFLGTLVIYY